MNQYGYTPERAREVFYFPDWTEKLERTSSDYGIPERPFEPPEGFVLEDIERTPEHLTWTIF